MTTLEQIRALALQGIGRLNAEATIGRRMTAEELTEFRKAQTVKALRDRAAKDRKHATSSADRVAKFVASRNEVGDIPAPRHRRLRERCRYDLEAFGWYYCRALLEHRASADIREGLIKDVQSCIRNGGQTAELFARGGGKTTWVDRIAPLWAMLYGHRRFPVIIGASLKEAKKNLKTVKRILSRSPEILADFPAIAIPIRALGGVSQRAAAQTYHGRATDVEWGTDQITLPTLRDDLGRPLDAGCGSILAVTGVGGAIRGTNEGGLRPDMLLIDDPQTRKIATSPKLVKGVLEYIQSDALPLAGHSTSIAAFLTITPQKFGDVATEISSSEKFQEWAKKVQPFVKQLPPNWEKLVALFCAEYAVDAANKDYKRTRSTAWYIENRALFEKLETIDAEQYDHAREADVCHHVLNLRAKLGRESFDAEIMMKVVDAASEIQIDADSVAESLNGRDRGQLPPGTDTVVGFCDINIQAGAGMSWALVAFGPNRVAAVIDYGRFPADGSPLVPPNSSDRVRNRRVAAAIREIVRLVATRRIRDMKGRAVRVRALGFDRGWLPDVLHRSLYVIRKRIPVGFPIVAMRGFPWNKFGTRKEDILRRGDHIFATRSRFGEYLAFMAPYWREVMQSGFLETPLMEGSLSLFGTDAGAHFQYATEVCAEKLVRKYQVYSGKETTTAWDWVTTGAEHFCDATTGAFALASWFRAYDTLSQTIDAAALGVRQPHQDDLFDPMQNSALLDSRRDAETQRGEIAGASPQTPNNLRASAPLREIYDGETDETEGTGQELPQLPEDGDLERDMEDGEASDPFAMPQFKRVTPVAAKQPVTAKVPRYRFKFKKGKWRK